MKGTGRKAVIWGFPLASLGGLLLAYSLRGCWQDYSTAPPKQVQNTKDQSVHGLFQYDWGFASYNSGKEGIKNETNETIEEDYLKKKDGANSVVQEEKPRKVIFWSDRPHLYQDYDNVSFLLPPKFMALWERIRNKEPADIDDICALSLYLDSDDFHEIAAEIQQDNRSIKAGFLHDVVMEYVIDNGKPANYGTDQDWQNIDLIFRLYNSEDGGNVDNENNRKIISSHLGAGRLWRTVKRRDDHALADELYDRMIEGLEYKRADYGNADNSEAYHGLASALDPKAIRELGHWKNLLSLGYPATVRREDVSEEDRRKLSGINREVDKQVNGLAR